MSASVPFGDYAAVAAIPSRVLQAMLDARDLVLDNRKWRPVTDTIFGSAMTFQLSLIAPGKNERNPKLIEDALCQLCRSTLGGDDKVHFMQEGDSNLLVVRESDFKKLQHAVTGLHDGSLGLGR